MDIGCGAGQTLLAAAEHGIAFGIDIDGEALRQGRIWADRHARTLHFTVARAERLPFADGTFDAVWARVSLAYTDLGRSLPELRRVLRAGGSAWLVLHTAQVPLQSARAGRWKQHLYFAYILLNSALFHVAGRTIPFVGNRYESFQTSSGMRRALRRFGFQKVTEQRDRHFVITAS